MIIHFTLNGAPQELTVNPGENVQKLLFNMGMHSVRNSDDGFGFAGSDAIIFNGNIVNASLLIAAQLEKADIRTAESLGKWNELSLVQQTSRTSPEPVALSRRSYSGTNASPFSRYWANTPRPNSMPKA